MMKHCTRCGAELPDEALFCPTCGEALVRSADDPLLGTVLAQRYLLQSRIGEGSSGIVYRAEHTTLRRPAAVKVLHHQLCSDDAAVERFRREATTVAAIDNEHILEVLDFGRADDGRLYFAMELLNGETLAEVLRREARLSPRRTVDLLTQIGEALMEAHGMGYVHRDLRPRNIFLTRKRGRDDFVKLLDFGLSKLIRPEGLAQQTALGMTFGDPRYMSPEQARGDAIDRRSDIYALGLIGYEMLTGVPPFSDAPTFQLLTQQIEEAPRPPRALRPEIPAALEQVLLTALNKRPDDRFVTVLRMVEALRQVALAAPAQAPPGPAAPRRAPVAGLRPQELPAAPPAAPVATPGPLAGSPSAATPPPAATAQARGAPPVTAAVTPMAAGPAPAPAEGASPAAPSPGAFEPGSQHPSTPAPPPAAPGLGARTMPYLPQAPRAAVASEASIPTALIPPEPEPPAPASMSHAWFAAGDAGEHGSFASSTASLTVARPRSRWPWVVVGGAVVAAVALAWWAGTAAPRAATDETVAAGPAGAPDAGSRTARPVPLAPPPSDARPTVAVAPGDGTATPHEAPSPAAAMPTAPAPHQPVAAATPTTPGPHQPVAAAPVTPAPRPSAAAPAPPGTARQPSAPRRSRARPPRAPRSRRPRPAAPRQPAARAPKPPAPPAPPAAAGADAAQVAQHLKAGWAHLRRGAHARAAAEFTAARELDSRNADAIAGLGEVAFEQGHYQEATVHLRAATRLRPRRASYHVSLGNAYYRLGRTRDAVAAYQKALRLNPKSEAARQGLEAARERLQQPSP